MVKQTKKNEKSATKRKTVGSSHQTEKAGSPAPKKKRGRRGKPKLDKVDYKKQVNQNLMMETLENNALMQNVEKKKEEFRQNLNNEVDAPSQQSQASSTTSKQNR